MVLLTESYYVRQFASLLTSSGEIVLQNDSGIVKITEKNLVKFILDIDQEGSKYVGTDYVLKYFPDNAQEVIKFLLTNKIIEKPPIFNFNLHKINFSTNDKSVGELTNRVLKNSIDNTYEYTFSNNIASSININESENAFWVIFMNPYSKKEAKKIRDKFIGAKNTYLLTSYIYNNIFFIDSLYSSDLKKPCHLCQINITESVLRKNASGGRMNYQNLVDLLYEENKTFNIEVPLNEIQIVNLVSYLCNRIIQHIGGNTHLKSSPALFGEGAALDLKNFNTHTGTTLHWELCDCYE